MGGFGSLAHLYIKIQSIRFLRNTYSVKGFDAKSEALISQSIANCLNAKIIAFPLKTNIKIKILICPYGVNEPETNLILIW